MTDLVSTVWVTNPDNNEPTAFGPGDDVPAWAKKQMGPHCFVDGDSEAEGGQSYAKQTKAELQAEIDARNEGRDEENQVVPDGDRKDDLVAALEADDAAQGA